MMRHAWTNYAKYAMGMDELCPISQTGKNWMTPSGLAATIVDSLDTLWIMDLKEEFREAADYAFNNVSMNQVLCRFHAYNL